MLVYLDAPPPAETAPELWVALLQLAASLGVVTAFAAIARSLWNAYRWKSFKKSVGEWLRDRAPAFIEHPNRMDEREWIASVEGLLTDSHFSPFECKQLLELAVPVAQQIVRSQLF